MSIAHSEIVVQLHPLTLVLGLFEFSFALFPEEFNILLMVINEGFFIWLESIGVIRVEAWAVYMRLANVAPPELIIRFFVTALGLTNLNFLIILKSDFQDARVTLLFRLFVLLFLFKFLVIFLRSLNIVGRWFSVSSNRLLLLRVLTRLIGKVLIGGECAVCSTFARVSRVIREVGNVAI